MSVIGRWVGNRPVAVKIGSVVAIALVTVVLVGGLGVRGPGHAVDRTAELQRLTGPTREALEADMAHDAIRADVQRAPLAGSSGEIAEARADLGSQAGTLSGPLAD